MNPDRLRALLAPAVASLFLVLVLCTFAVQRPVSVGINVPITRVRQIPIENCFNGLSDRDIVIRIQNDGSTWINETTLSRGDIRNRLLKIYEYREERVAYLLVDPNVSYGEFADVYGQVASSSPDLHIGLLTRQVRSQIDRCPSGSGCTIEWPNEPSNIDCKNAIPIVGVLRFPAR
jgi:biopolymer transport protein ExbD